MKVHHEGFLDSQTANLAGNTGLPYVDSAVAMSDMANGDESWELPIPATYIIERDSTVLYASSNPDYTERPEPGEILTAVKRP